MHQLMSSEYRSITPGGPTLDSPLGLSHPFTDQITRTDAEKRTLGLGSHGLCQETLPRPWRSVQQDPLPRRSFAREQLRKLDREDDGFFEGLFRLFESGNIFPSYVRSFRQDRA